MVKTRIQNRKAPKSKTKKPVATKKVDIWQNKQLKKIISMSTPEIKQYRGIVTTDQNVQNTGYIIDLINPIIKGTDANERVGDSIKVLGFTFKVLMKNPGTYKYRNIVGANKNDSLTISSFPAVLGHMDPDQFTMYRDITYANDTTKVGPVISYSKSFGTKGKVCTWDIGGNPLHQIWFYLVSDEDPGVSTTTKFTIQWTVNYTDV